jgi:hypothetical protein
MELNRRREFETETRKRERRRGRELANCFIFVIGDYFLSDDDNK